MKIIFYISILSSLLLGFLCSANTGTITVKGNIRDNTCEVAAASNDFSVNLLSNSSKQFGQVGSTTQKIPFRIVLSRCGAAAQAVKIGFTGLEDQNNDSLLKIDNTPGSAVGIGIQILNANSVVIPVNSPQSFLPWVSLIPNQPNTVQFFARMMSTQLPIVAGNVSSTANFTLEFQ
ncbi:fimbrial protein [Providencia rettgeri]